MGKLKKIVKSIFLVEMPVDFLTLVLNALLVCITKTTCFDFYLADILFFPAKYFVFELFFLVRAKFSVKISTFKSIIFYFSLKIIKI